MEVVQDWGDYCVDEDCRDPEGAEGVAANENNGDGLREKVPDDDNVIDGGEGRGVGVAENVNNEGDEANVEPLNPVDIPEVVSHICEFLPVEDLKNFRFMNKMINYEVCQLLRKKQKTVFRSMKDISAYANIMKQGILHFHETFVLNDLDLMKMKPEEVKTINEFLAEFGPRVKKCSITLTEKLMLPFDWWTLLYNMPNLVELKVSLGSNFYSSMGPNDFGCTVFESQEVPIPPPTSRIPRFVGNPIHNNPFGRMFRRPGPEALLPPVGEPPEGVEEFEELHDQFWQAEVDNVDSDDEPGPGGVINFGLRTIGKRLPKPEFTDEERNQFGSLIPKLCLLRLRRLHFTLKPSTRISEAIFNFVQTILAASHSSLTSIETDSFETDIFMGKIILDCLKTSGLSFPRVRILNLWLKLDESEVAYLGTLRHLSKIKIVLEQGIKGATFHQLISTCCLNLTYLGLVIQNSQLACCLDMKCYLPKLHTFMLLGYKGPLTFLRYMPALQVLDLYTVECRFLMDALMNSEGRYNVQSLEVLTAVQLRRTSPPVGIFLGSVNSLPNLQCLELDNCDDDLMELVYKAMPNLRELKVSGTFTDVGITGIARQNCEEILEQCAHFVVEDRSVRQYLYIGNLTKLKRLSLSSENISDLSIMFGVAKLMKLKTLTISGSRITEIGVEVIKSYMILQYLNMSGCPNVSEAALSKISDVWGCSIFIEENPGVSFPQPNLSQLMNFNHRDYMPLLAPRAGEINVNQFNENLEENALHRRYNQMRAQHLEHRRPGPLLLDRQRLNPIENHMVELIEMEEQEDLQEQEILINMGVGNEEVEGQRLRLGEGVEFNGRRRPLGYFRHFARRFQDNF